MSLIRSAQLNGHDPYVYLKDVLDRLPTHCADDNHLVGTTWCAVSNASGSVPGRGAWGETKGFDVAQPSHAYRDMLPSIVPRQVVTPHWQR